MKWLFLPGLACRSEIWEEAAARLPAVEPVLLDWPWPEELATVHAAAEWLGQRIDEHDPVGIVGHSLGGFVALHLFGALQRRPQLRLVIVDTFLAEPDPVFRNHVWAGPAALERRVASMLDQERPRFPILRAAAMGFTETDAWVAQATGTGAAFVYGGRGGDHSDVELARLAGLPDAADNAVHVVPRTSHFLMWEQPEPFYRILAALTEET